MPYAGTCSYQLDFPDYYEKAATPHGTIVWDSCDHTGAARAAWEEVREAALLAFPKVMIYLQAVQ